jgi:hypothetical protein
VYAYVAANNSALHSIVVCAGHEIEVVNQLYLDSRKVLFGASPDPRWATSLQKDPNLSEYDARYDNKIFMAQNLGSESQLAQPDAITETAQFAESSRWTTDHRLLGCAHVYLILVNGNELWPDGLPDIDFLVSGKKCYDPRNGLTQFTANGALVIADYLMDSRYGVGASLSEIDIPTLIEAANICDEEVVVAGGGIESRYQINGSFDSDSTPRDILEEMAAAISGDVVLQDGKWRILPGAYRSPSLGLTQDDLRSSIEVTTMVSRRDNFNRIRGTYTSLRNNYDPEDFPPITNSFYEEQDGEILWKDVTYNFVVSPYHAQRIAKIELEKVRQSITVQITASLKAWNLRIGDTVELTLGKYGWANKVFEVRDLSFDHQQGEGILVSLTLQETGSAIYEFNGGSPTLYDIAPNTELPNPFAVENPTNVVLESGTNALFLRQDGTVWSRIRVSWTPPSDSFVSEGGQVDIQFKQSTATNWREVTRTSGNQTEAFIVDVKENVSYDVRLRAINSIGIPADIWIEVLGHVVIGKSEPPSDVQGLTAAAAKFSIGLEWSEVPDLDLDCYEIREGSTWEEASLVTCIRSTSLKIDPRIAHTYRFHVRAVDTSGNVSLNSAIVDLSLFLPGTPSPSYYFEGADVIIEWDEVTSRFQIDEYEIRRGDEHLTAVLVDSLKAQVFRRRVEWEGNRTFWVTTRDVAGNFSTPAQVEITVASPNAVSSFSAEVVDNNVYLRWVVPAITSLPIETYRVYRGAQFESSEFVAQVTGTFQYIMEFLAGTYTYWVEAVDTAGNTSQVRSITAVVNTPPDFVLRANRQVDALSGVNNSNIYILGKEAATTSDGTIGFLLPFITESDDVQSGNLGNIIVSDQLPLYGPVLNLSYEDWFDNYNHNSLQDQIDDGYTKWIQPGSVTGQWEGVEDFEAVIEGGTLVDFIVRSEIVEGSVQIRKDIGFSTDNVNITWYTNVESVFEKGFRYVHPRLVFTGADDKSIAVVTEMRLRLSLKKIRDNGRWEITDANAGVFVPFNEPFADVVSLIVTAKDEGQSYGIVPSYAFADVPNPTGFTVFAHRSDTGVKITAEGSWAAIGS